MRITADFLEYVIKTSIPQCICVAISNYKQLCIQCSLYFWLHLALVEVLIWQVSFHVCVAHLFIYVDIYLKKGNFYRLSDFKLDSNESFLYLQPGMIEPATYKRVSVTVWLSLPKNTRRSSVWIRARDLPNRRWKP